MLLLDVVLVVDKTEFIFDKPDISGGIDLSVGDNGIGRSVNENEADASKEDNGYSFLFFFLALPLKYENYESTSVASSVSRYYSMVELNDVDRSGHKIELLHRFCLI